MESSITNTCGGRYPWKEEKTIYEEDTEFFHLRIADSIWGDSAARIMFLNNVPSTAERSGGEPAFEYMLKARVVYGLAGNVQAALAIGVAGGTIVEEIKRYFSDAIVEGVELDKKTIEAGRTYFSLNDDARTNIIIDDGRHYVKTTGKTYGLIFVDVFNGFVVPTPFTTRNFFSSLKKRLNFDGIVIINIISALEGRDSKLFVRMLRNLMAVFCNVLTIPVWEDRKISQNILFVATGLDVAAFIKKYERDIYTK